MRFVTLLTLAGILAGAAAAGGATADEAFEALAERFLDEYPALSPVSATALGDHRFDGELDEVSAAARQAEAALYRRFLEALAGIPRDELARANQVDAALLEHQLEAGLWRLEELAEWSWNPLTYTRLAGGAIYGLVARDFAPLETRLARVADRLEKLPRLLAQVRETLVPARVPAVHAETAVKQNRGVISLLDGAVRPHLEALPAAERERLAGAMDAAAAAVEEHQRWLESVLVPAAAGEFRLGAELFDRKLALTLDSPLSRQEILERAESEFQRVRKEMYEVALEVYAAAYPYTRIPEAADEAYQQALIRAALEMAYRRKPGRDEIVEVARRQLEQTTAFVLEKDLVSVPDDPIEIIVMPEFQRGVAVAYCDSPGPLEAGQKTFYAVAPLPEEWTEEQVDSFLREYNLLSLQDLTIHEAMPGHYLQLAHSNRYPSKLRAVLSSGPFVEGWAVYAERLMIDAGYLDGDPLMRLINLKWYLRAVANAILDQKIHLHGMTEEEALELMIEGAFQEEREAAGKWVRAQLTSAQLSTYFVGYQEHIDLRREVEALEGEAFSQKAYHDRLLSFGSPPVRFARALMLERPVPR